MKADNDIEDSADILQKALTNLSQTDQSILHGVFDSIDVNGDGFLTPNEIASLLNKVGFRKGGRQRYTDEMIKKFLQTNNSLDKNDDGKLEFSEFVGLFSKSGEINMAMEAEDISQCFKIIDVDKSGFLEIGELKDIYERLGINLEPKDVDYLLKEIDENSDGKIDLSEFQRMLTAKIGDA